MAAFIGSLLSLMLKRSNETAIKTFKIPLPPVSHRVLDEPLLSKFEEIFVIGDVHGFFDELMIMLKCISNHDKILNCSLVI